MEIRDQATEAIREFRDTSIGGFAANSGQPFGYETFAYDASEKDERLGSINGFRLYDWLYVEFLVVRPAARGKGVGSLLMDRAEALARDMGLMGVALDTFRYQAEPFYAARGYEAQMIIPGAVPERDRIYMRKTFGTA